MAARVRGATVVVAALSVFVASVAFYAVWSTQAMARRTAELGRQVAALASGLSAGGPIEGSGDAGLRARLLRVQAGLIGARLIVVDADGRVMFSTFEPGEGPQSIDLSVFSRPDAQGVRVAVRDVASGERLLLVAAPIRSGGYLVGAQTVRDVQKTRSTLVAVLAACMLLALAVAWFAGGTIAQRVAAPLARLKAGAEGIAAGQWGAEVPVEGDEEVAALAQSFNDMSRRVAAVYEAQKSFVSDVSHEIRTPVASIAGYAHAIADGTASDVDTVVRFARVIESEARRLADISSTLLALSDLDAGRVEVARTPVDPRALADALRVRFTTAGDRLAIDALDPGGARPNADAERLLQVASVLVDNALKYAGPTGTVRVSAQADEESWSLVVDDDGPGVPADARERIFERFVRLDQARASGGGSGLGLSIAKRLVELMGGSIAVSDSPLGGARFVVRLPRA
ncbi:HAMP domain-containing histidine kinase [Coriobacteriia bacterium Es71-Z0120]|uniref:sensor histidine kinase n=1 Tax=Parvivirga hydrogeniphila TaxID=2939460 RepID=UPI0022608515|nr:HAMP domain-containing sensor histidine kinase [Parvivirga hydrogeniphila]MCL4079521.1 HAMP domain-containing histidine kinase [Parvivirga hydrogeniphila]